MTLELVATGAATYQWASGETTARLVTVPNVSAKYQVTGTGNNGCTRTAMVDVKVLPLPTVSITGDASVCLNSLAKLYAKGNANVYYWSNGSVSDSINPLITAKTKFVVQGLTYMAAKGATHLWWVPSLRHRSPIRATQLSVAERRSCLWPKAPRHISGIMGSTAAYYSAVPTMDTTTYTVERVAQWLLQHPQHSGAAVCGLRLSGLRVSPPSAPVTPWKLLAKGAKTYVWSNGTAGEALAAQPLTSRRVPSHRHRCPMAAPLPLMFRSRSDSNLRFPYR